MADNALEYFCLKCKKIGIQHERYCKNCKEQGLGKVETYYKCPICQHSMRYSNVWKHQKISCSLTKPVSPPIATQIPHPIPSTPPILPRTLLPQPNQYQFNSSLFPQSNQPQMPVQLPPLIIPPMNEGFMPMSPQQQPQQSQLNYNLLTLGVANNTLPIESTYHDYVFEILETNVIEPITDPLKFYMNRILNKPSNEIEALVEEILMKRPDVFERVKKSNLTLIGDKEVNTTSTI